MQVLVSRASPTSVETAVKQAEVLQITAGGSLECQAEHCRGTRLVMVLLPCETGNRYNLATIKSNITRLQNVQSGQSSSEHASQNMQYNFWWPYHARW